MRRSFFLLRTPNVQRKIHLDGHKSPALKDFTTSKMRLAKHRAVKK